MDYDEDGNVLHGLGDDGDPTIGTSAAEIAGSFPTYHPELVSWSNPLGIGPGVMTQEAQTLSPYIIAAGPNNQPQISAYDTFNQGVTDLSTAAENAANDLSDTLNNLGTGAANLLKWGVIALIAVAVLETNKTARQFAPERKAKRRRK